MRINSTTNQLASMLQSKKSKHNFSKTNQSSALSIKFRASACEIEKALAQKGITCNFAGNSFVADCIKKQ